MPEYLEWVIPGVDYVENWEFRRFKKFPPEDATDDEIMEFVEDAINAQKKIEHFLIVSGESKEEARKKACQYPLKKNAPMEAIRSFINFYRDLYEETTITP